MRRFYFTQSCSCGIKEGIWRVRARYQSFRTPVLCPPKWMRIVKDRKKILSGCRQVAYPPCLFPPFTSAAVLCPCRGIFCGTTLFLKEEKGNFFNGKSTKKENTVTEFFSLTASEKSKKNFLKDSTATPGSSEEKSSTGAADHSSFFSTSTTTGDGVGKNMDMSTKITGFGGVFTTAEKVAELQENFFSVTPPLNSSGTTSCCAHTASTQQESSVSERLSSQQTLHSRFSGMREPRTGKGEAIGEPHCHHEDEDAGGRRLQHAHVPRPIMPAPLPPPLSRQEAAARVEEALCAAVASAAKAPTSASSSSSIELKTATDQQKALGRIPVASIERLLVEGTIESIRGSSALKSRPKGEAHRGVQRLLDYNKQWAAEVSRFNPTYFADLATEQKPEYLWIGCSDSRVPANEIVGLHPGDVFVHRNIGNIFSLSDLNCLSALQFAVDCLKVEHVIIAGHYKCGGVTAAMQGQKLGLTEHWIMQVTDIKNRWWGRVTNEVPECDHLNVLCELNVIEQLYHVVSCCVVQRRWKALDAMERGPNMEDKSHILVRDSYAKHHPIFEKNHPGASSRVFSKVERPVDVEVHGWVYSLDDGMLRPLLRITRRSNIEKAVNDAREAIFVRYALS